MAPTKLYIISEVVFILHINTASILACSRLKYNLNKGTKHTSSPVSIDPGQCIDLPDGVGWDGPYMSLK